MTGAGSGSGAAAGAGPAEKQAAAKEDSQAGASTAGSDNKPAPTSNNNNTSKAEKRVVLMPDKEVSSPSSPLYVSVQQSRICTDIAIQIRLCCTDTSRCTACRPRAGVRAS